MDSSYKDDLSPLSPQSAQIHPEGMVRIKPTNRTGSSYIVNLYYAH